MKEIDRPRVVHARVASIIDKDNLFAQLTVRMRTEQVKIFYIFKYIVQKQLKIL